MGRHVNTYDDTRLVLRFQLLARITSGLVFVISCLVLLGWALDIEALKTVLPGLKAMNPGTAVGFLPDPNGDAPAILREMCGRCHTGQEDPGMRRARFDARNPPRLTRASMSEAMRRMQLAEQDPEVMPPRRAGHLPAWAIQRISDYFATR